MSELSDSAEMPMRYLETLGLTVDQALLLAWALLIGSLLAIVVVSVKLVSALFARSRSRVSNGKTLFLEAVDGRSPMARRYRDVLADLVSDLGGDPTEAQSLVARRAATLAVWCEMEKAALASGNKFSIGEYTSAANTMHRLLAALGLERRMRDVTPTIDAYLNGGAR